MSYGDYLALDRLLACQNPLTQEHDEVLFIIMHQASELWIKLCLHEVAGAIRAIRTDELGAAFKMIARVGRVQANLIQSWEILSTMTPFDYARVPRCARQIVGLPVFPVPHAGIPSRQQEPGLGARF